MVASEEGSVDELRSLVRRAYPYRELTDDAFEAVLTMLADGFSTRRGRRSAHVHYDRVNGRLRGRRGARLSAITSGGTIPDLAEYEVTLEPAGVRVGTSYFASIDAWRHVAKFVPADSSTAIRASNTRCRRRS